MRSRLIVSALLVMVAASQPALAQEPRHKGGIPTETQRRMAHRDAPFPWDLVGLFGLIGLIGLRRKHPDDSYHPSSIE